MKGVGGLLTEGEGEEWGVGLAAKTRRQGAKLVFGLVLQSLEKGQVGGNKDVLQQEGQNESGFCDKGGTGAMNGKGQRKQN